MSLPEDLLEQSRFLLTRERGKPKQASLRRAVSSAYYAVFHLLTADAASQAAPPAPEGLRDRVQRGLSHGTMKKAAEAFDSKKATPWIDSLLKTPPIHPSVASVARSFVRLQEERHKADYDVADRFDRPRVLVLVNEAEKTFRDWNAVRNTDDARLFLASLMFWNLWSK